MEFITTDGKLIVQDNTIQQKRLNNNWWIKTATTIYFFLFFINQFSKEIDRVKEQGKQSAWVGIVLYGLIVLLGVGTVAIILLRHVLVNKINISGITEIKLANTDDGLVKNVIVKTKSGRHKLYEFRVLEKEYERLIEHLLWLNPAITILTPVR